jgi:hypothetical protein
MLEYPLRDVQELGFVELVGADLFTRYTDVDSGTLYLSLFVHAFQLIA